MTPEHSPLPTPGWERSLRAGLANILPILLRSALLLLLLGCTVAIAILGGAMKQVVAEVKPEIVCAWDASKPILRMELVRNASDVEALLGKPETQAGQAARKSMADAQYLDFPFIPVYVMLFLTVALINAGFPAMDDALAKSVDPEEKTTRLNIGFPAIDRIRLRWVGALLALAIILAGIADAMEDRAILDVLKDPSSAANVSWWALAKWRLIVGAGILEGAILAVRERRTVVQTSLHCLLGSGAIFAASLCLWAACGQPDAVLDANIDLCFAGFGLLVLYAIFETIYQLVTGFRRVTTGKVLPYGP